MRDEWAEYHELMAKNEKPSLPPQSHLNGSSQQSSLPPTQDTSNAQSALSRLRSAAVNDRLEEMEQRLEKERDVIPQMITTGTVTLVYAPSGAGKTVWILGNLFQSIDNGLIRGEDVIYFNEDDGARGVIQKAKLGDQRGMTMVTLSNSNDPSLRNTGDALRLLNLIRMEGEADGKIVICDTLKKFAPVLNKGDMREVLHVFREFAASGGTVILLGHCNKHRTMDGRLVYEGVGDLKADVDNMFGLDPLNDKYAPYQELLVINEKDRSQVSFKGGFKYKQTSQLIDYKESVASVEFLGEDDIENLTLRQKAQINIAKAKAHYEDEFFFLKAAMKTGQTFSQSDLYRMLYDDEINPNECTKKTLRNCMKLLQGNYLQMERVGQYNAKHYKWVTY
jgi:archaellum biogenesis ATPase FlaH